MPPATGMWAPKYKVGWVNGGSACETHATSCDNDTEGASSSWPSRLGK